MISGLKDFICTFGKQGNLLNLKDHIIFFNYCGVFSVIAWGFVESFHSDLLLPAM